MVLTRSRKAISNREAAASTRNKPVKPLTKVFKAKTPGDKPRPGSPDFIALEPASKSRHGGKKAKLASVQLSRVRFEPDPKTKADSTMRLASNSKSRAVSKLDETDTIAAKTGSQAAKTFAELTKSISYDTKGWQSVSYPGDRYLQALQRLTSIAGAAAGKMRYELDREIWMHQKRDTQNIARLQVVNQCFGRIAIAAQLQLAICEYLSRDKGGDRVVEVTRSAKAEGVLKLVESLMDDLQISRAVNDFGAPMFRQILQHIRADDRSIKFRQETDKLQAQSENNKSNVGNTHIGPSSSDRPDQKLNKDWDGVFRVSGIEEDLSSSSTSPRTLPDNNPFRRIASPFDNLDTSKLHLDSTTSRIGGKDALRHRNDHVDTFEPFARSLASGTKADSSSAPGEAGAKKRKRQADARPDAAYKAGYESDEQLVALMEAVEDEGRQPPKRGKRALPRHRAIALANAKIAEKLQAMTEKQAADAQAALIEESRRKVAGLEPLARTSGQQKMGKKYPAVKRSSKKS